MMEIERELKKMRYDHLHRSSSSARRCELIDHDSNSREHVLSGFLSLLGISGFGPLLAKRGDPSSPVRSNDKKGYLRSVHQFK